MRRIYLLLIILFGVLLGSGCVTQKKKDEEVTKVGKFIHDVTSKYNAFYNANILMENTMATIDEQTRDNYTKPLPIFKYFNADTTSIAGDLNTAIEKNTVAITLHRPSHWTDDNYLMIGQAKFLMKDYEFAQSTFEYLVEEFDPVYIAQLEAEADAKANRYKSKGKKKKRKKSSAKKKSSSKTKVEPKSEPVLDPKTGEKVKPDAYVFKHRPAFQEGQLWLAKTYIEREKFGDAERLLYQLYRDPKTFKDVKAGVVATLAYYELEKREAPQEAIKYLEEAIEISRKKAIKARFAFILAQIYERQENDLRARELYDQVIKMNPAYEMVFNAKLNLVLNANLNGVSDNESTIAALKKMTRDFKNIDYQDQIFFAMAQIALQNGERAIAIDYLKTAIASAVGNNVQRAEAYLTLAELYFEDQSFVLAKNYYDSTMVDMPITDERYEGVKRYSENLKDIADNIQIITLQDSLLVIAAMDPVEKKKLASDILKERRRQQILANLATATATAPGSQGTRAPALNNSSFFAYDDKQVKKGGRDFKRTWGNRPLEDDWRRSAKFSFNVGDEVAIDESGAPVDQELTEDELNNVLSDVPSTPEQISEANTKIMNAMFALGKAFRDRLEDNIQCVTTLEGMLERFPDFEEKKEAYYYLYLAHNSLNQSADAKRYYNLITQQYPESTFAQILTDPDYAKKVIEKENQLRAHYDKAYKLFQVGKIKEGCDMVNESKLLFGEKNTLSAKFALLSAMCNGKQDGKPAYVKGLRDVIAQYPDTEEKLKAEEMLRVLIGARYDPTRKRADAPDRNMGKVTVYKTEPDKLHYCIVVFRDKEMTLDEAKLKIAEFNKFHFKDARLRISNLFLDPESKTPIVVIRRFTDQANAMVYYNTTVEKPAGFLGKRTDFDLYPVTQFNYREILKKRSLQDYDEFFRDNYLNN